MADEQNGGGAPADSEFVELTTMPAPEDVATVDINNDPDAAPAKTDGEGEGDADADADKPKGEGDGEEGDDEPLRDERGRYKNRSEARIAELTRARRQAERERDEAIARLNGARDPAEAAKPKPSPDDFEDYGEYVEALTDWKADQREAARAGTDAERAAERAAETRNAEWGARVAEVSAAIPEWDEVVGKSEIKVLDHVAAAIMDSDPRVMLHLAKNPELADSLNEMSPMRAAVEIGKIEASLETAAPPKPPAKKPSDAPAPITPVKPGATTAKDPANMSQDEYNAWRAEQLKR